MIAASQLWRSCVRIRVGAVWAVDVTVARRHLLVMVDFDRRWSSPPPPVLEMSLDGRFREVPAAPWGGGVVRIAALIAMVAGAAALAALALWIALALVPIAVGAALIAYGALRFQAWRMRRALFGGGRDLDRL